MLRHCCLVFVLQNLLLAVHCADRYSRNDFPSGFIFGSGSSAYQVEGAVDEDGRTPSIWDTSTHSGKCRGATGDVATDEYHKYKEDVQLMAQTGLDAYRFSISWSRLIPYGRGPVSPKGLEYYNNLINELISHGIQPHVTLYNFDLPQALEDEYGGWLSQKIVKDFTAYADVCFREFGDRVSFWATVNEPNAMAIGGYDQGSVPPARCSSPYGVDCTKGNSSSEPYIVIRHAMLAHASAVKLYRKKYKGKQHGLIGLAIYSLGFVPLTNSTEDVIATRRATDFVVGCIAHPLVFGDYPDVMKKNVGSRLLPFSNHESKLIKGSFDFIGVMHYFPVHIKDNPSILEPEDRDFNADMGASLIGKRTQRNSSLQDISRVEYMHAYIGSVLDAVRNGSNTRGYFAWSFLDLFELDGYESSYGLYYVDLDDPDLRRYPKLSANWYSDFLKGEHVSTDGVLKLREPPSILSKNRLFQQALV